MPPVREHSESQGLTFRARQSRAEREAWESGLDVGGHSLIWSEWRSIGCSAGGRRLGSGIRSG
jgi:hypothetical protein